MAICRCASAPIVRSPSAKMRPSRNSLKPCLVESRIGTPANVPAVWP